MAQQQQDSSNDAMWAIFGIIAVLLIVTYFFGEKILASYLSLKMLEGSIISIIFPLDSLNHALSAIKTSPILGKTPNEVWVPAAKTISRFSSIPFILIIAYVAYKFFSNNPYQKYKRVHSMESLAKSEADVWTWISPVINLNLSSEDIEKGKWSMALRPIDFVKKYKLLDENNVLIKDQAEKIFIAQLGALWDGLDRVPPYVKALFAIFIAYGCYDKKGGEDGIRILAKSFTTGKPDYSFVKGLLDKHWYKYDSGKPAKFTSQEHKKHYEKVMEAKRLVESHAYVYTVMPTMLEFARATGVLPSNYFIWLRPQARTLWYILNCVGRKVAFCEVAGVYNHWIAEKVAEKKLETPYIEKAIIGLETELGNIKM